MADREVTPDADYEGTRRSLRRWSRPTCQHPHHGHRYLWSGPFARRRLTFSTAPALVYWPLPVGQSEPCFMGDYTRETRFGGASMLLAYHVGAAISSPNWGRNPCSLAPTDGPEAPHE